MNKIEVVDGIRGKWRTVKKPTGITDGQPIRYDTDHCRFGYADSLVEGGSVRKAVEKEKAGYFIGWEGVTQAFFPLPVKTEKKKVKKGKSK